MNEHGEKNTRHTTEDTSCAAQVCPQSVYVEQGCQNNHWKRSYLPWAVDKKLTLHQRQFSAGDWADHSLSHERSEDDSNLFLLLLSPSPSSLLSLTSHQHTQLRPYLPFCSCKLCMNLLSDFLQQEPCESSDWLPVEERILVYKHQAGGNQICCYGSWKRTVFSVALASVQVYLPSWATALRILIAEHLPVSTH